MSRRVVVALVAVAAVTLSGCGAVSTAQATTGWEHSANFRSNTTTLVSEAHAATRALERHLSANALHTVCEVLFTDASAANSSLPTPDRQATSLLATGYSDLGQGAVDCYRAFASATETTAAVSAIRSGLETLGLAKLRLGVVTSG